MNATWMNSIALILFQVKIVVQWNVNEKLSFNLISHKVKDHCKMLLLTCSHLNA